MIALKQKYTGKWKDRINEQKMNSISMVRQIFEWA